MIRVIVNALFFLLILTHDIGEHARPKTVIMTKVVDIKPAFLDSHRHALRGFVYNFNNMTNDNVPKYNFLSLKTATEFNITGNATTSVLPTLDYQAVYFYVHEGSVFIQIQMCEGGQIINGGHATKGWNLVALDFPKLLHLGRCRNFSMNNDRPTMYLNGSSHFTLWRIESFLYSEVPVTFFAGLISHQFILFVAFIAIAFFIFDSCNNQDETPEKQPFPLSELPPSYEQVIESNQFALL